MSSLPQYRVTPDEYLRRERAAEIKSEYDDGVLLAMSGASLRHNLIVGNLIRSLGNRRPPHCRVYPRDVKVRGREEVADEHRDILLNPLLVVEVLSESTAAYDRGRKFLSYQQIESLQEFLLVTQDDSLVEHYRRDEGHWVYTRAEGRENVIALPGLGCELPLGEIYEQVEF